MSLGEQPKKGRGWLGGWAEDSHKDNDFKISPSVCVCVCVCLALVWQIEL